jgi:hypothetical protein
LRERAGDVLLLAEAFLARTSSDYGLSPPTLALDAKQTILDHNWPGNVRELANVIERAVLLSDSPVIRGDDLGLSAARAAGGTPADQSGIPAVQVPSVNEPSEGSRENVRRSVEDYERCRLLEALELARWNISRAADALGIPRTSLRYRMDKLGLQSPEASTTRPKLGSGPGTPDYQIESMEASPVPVRRHSAARATFLRLRAVWREVPRLGLAAGWGVDRLVEKVQAFGGMVLTRDQTGFDAVFGLEPTEDAPSRAANAALAVEKLVERLRGHQAMPDIVMALHTAACLVATTAGTVGPVPEAMRDIESELTTLVARGVTGAIIVGPTTAPLIQRRFKLEPFDGNDAAPERQAD